jgi:hypothetical protein
MPASVRLAPEGGIPVMGRMDETPTVAARPAAGKKTKKKR